MKPLFSVLAAFLSFFFVLPVTGAFTFTFGTPSQCDNLPLTWMGGTPPFQLSVFPVFGAALNISIPNSAFNGGKGFYSFPLAVAAGNQTVLTMSDATGFNSGGTTNLLTVLASKGGSCDLTANKIAFSYELNSALQQCRPFEFSGFDAATQPVTIGGVVPGGTAFTIGLPNGTTSFPWTANVARGTSLIFFMTDGLGRTGGSSDLLLVGSSDDSSCLGSSSLSSTPGAPSATTKNSPSTISSPSSSSLPASSSTAAGGGISLVAVVGGVIGGLLFLAIIIITFLFCLRRGRDTSRDSSVSNIKRRSPRTGSEMGPIYDPSLPTSATRGSLTSPSSVPLASNPFIESSSTDYRSRSHRASTWFDTTTEYSQDSDLSYQNTDIYQSPPQAYPPYQQGYPPYPSAKIPPPPIPTSRHALPDPFHSQPSQRRVQPSTSRATTAQRKFAAAGAVEHRPARFIVHTDVDDDPRPPTDEEIVELPPQYSERPHRPQGSTDPAPSLANTDYHRPGALYPP